MNVYFWLGAIIVFGIIEALTSGIVSIWFAFGSLAALISAALHADVLVQVIVFLFFSALSLILTRPLIKKKLLAKTTPTNADMLIGETAVVCELIDNLSGTGAVKVRGKVWSAKSIDDRPISEATAVTIEKIEGVKLIVKLSQ